VVVILDSQSTNITQTLKWSCEECFYHKNSIKYKVSEKKIFQISANQKVQLALAAMFQVHVEDYYYQVWLHFGPVFLEIKTGKQIQSNDKTSLAS